ncbi:MAG: response regulator [Candidatus Zixiibacteriota bacterium]
MECGAFRLLIVDDDQDDFILCREILKEIKNVEFVVEWTSQPDEFFDSVAKHSHDVYLIDYYLGEYCGLDLVSEARRRGCILPLILLTGQGDDDVDHQAVKAGASDYLLKSKIEGPQLERSIRYSIDRMMAAKELWESEEKYRALSENSPDIIARFDEKCRHLYVNSAIEHFYGMAANKFIGKTHKDLNFPQSAADFWENNIKLVLETNQDVHVEFETSNSNGKLVFDIRLIPEFSADGTVDSIMSTMRDITETKRLQEFSARAQRLETAGRIAGQVAHDFNNILAPLVAYPDLIAENLPADSPLLQYLETMKNSALKISEINQQLLSLGRRGHYNQEPLNINSLILQTLDEVQDIPDTLNIEVDLPDDLMNVLGGPAQINRVITNLIYNARDAMNDIGTLKIRSENFCVVQNNYGIFNKIPKGQYVKITISDTGTGIPDKVLSKFFDPFFTTKSQDRKRGSGLGLSVVHAVIDDHNGYIDCTSEIGKGTSMYIYFKPTDKTKNKPSTNQIVGGSEKMLVVDDDPMQREVTNYLLGKLGYEVFSVDCGKEAVKNVPDIKPDLVILDMIMPNGMDGTETLEKILEINPHQKSIIVSGYAESERVRKAIDLGAGAFIRKPLTLKTIAHAVRNEIDSKTATAEIA